VGILHKYKVPRQEEKCVICDRLRESESLYCKYHRLAYERLKSGYNEWRKRKKNITWSKYLDVVYNNKYTGKWIKEVIEGIRRGKHEGKT